MTQQYDLVISKLLEHGAHNAGNDWTCPVHKNGQETKPSLSVNEGDKGVVMRCGSGCSTADVLTKLHLSPNELFYESRNTLQQRQIEATYDYLDAQGNLKYQVVRFNPKGFAQRHRDGRGNWVWSLKGISRTIYRLPQVIAAVASDIPIYIVEGEKDADTLVAKGYIASCNSGGAGKWEDEFADYFSGANVIVIRDKDDKGIEHANQVHASLITVAKSVKIFESPYAKDTTEHFLKGYALVDLVEIEAEVVEPAPTALSKLKDRLLSIDDIDGIEPPQFLVSDYLVANTLAVMYGQPGSAKSFIALDWALSMAHGVDNWMDHKVLQGSVLYLVAEGLSGIKQRKHSWRDAHAVVTKGDLTWLRDPVNLLDEEQSGALIELCDELQPMLFVVDTLARCLPGVDENASAPMSGAVELLDEIRRRTMGCVLMVHHTPKDGNGPRGHSSLLGAVQTAIAVEKDGHSVSVKVQKQKDSEEVTDSLLLTPMGESAYLVKADESSLEDSYTALNDIAVLEVIRRMTPLGGINAKDVIDQSRLSRSVVFRSLATLADRNQITKVGHYYRTLGAELSLV